LHLIATSLLLAPLAPDAQAASLRRTRRRSPRQTSQHSHPPDDRHAWRQLRGAGGWLALWAVARQRLTARDETHPHAGATLRDARFTTAHHDRHGAVGDHPG
jgi:hypothetical protein